MTAVEECPRQSVVDTAIASQSLYEAFYRSTSQKVRDLGESVLSAAGTMAIAYADRAVSSPKLFGYSRTDF
jgi:hypothetical protein